MGAVPHDGGGGREILKRSRSKSPWLMLFLSLEKECAKEEEYV